MKAIITGSFDPVTLGHENIIRRAAKLFDEITVAVCLNSSKVGVFSKEQRLELLRAAFGNDTRIRIVVSEGLLADYCAKNGIPVIVRGIRSVADFDYETSLSRINRSLVPELETVFLPCDPAYSHISSNVVREMLRYGKSPDAFVSPAVLAKLREMMAI